MKKLIGIFCLLLVGLVALAFYRSWLSVEAKSTESGTKSGIEVNVTVDKSKIKKDAEGVSKGAKELIDDASRSTRELIDKAKKKENGAGKEADKTGGAKPGGNDAVNVP